MAVASCRVITSIDDFIDTSAAASMAPMVLRPCAIRGEIVRADFGDVVAEVDTYSFPFATRGETLAGRVAVLVPLRRTMSGHVNGELLVPGCVLAFGELSKIAGACTAPVHFGQLSIDVQALLRAAWALGTAVDVPRRGEFRAIAVAEWERLRGLLLRVARTARHGGDVPAAIGNGFVEIIARSFASAGEDEVWRPRARINSVHVVRACEDLALSSSYQNITLTDLCKASGVSERRVRHAFYECYGMSPTGYLRIAALNEVRRELLEAPLTRDAVTRAASQFGFWHLGRFAAQYRALFGESPSATIAGRLGRCEAAAS